MSSEHILGLVLQCDEKGLVSKVFRNDFSIPSYELEGRIISSFAPQGMASLILNFLFETKTRGMLMDAPLSLELGNHIVNLNFTGFAVDNNIWIVGATQESASILFINELQQINNEQSNQIRKLIKLNYSQTDKTQEPVNDIIHLDELSSLNNELINLQRELSEKNAELARTNELKNQFLGMAAHDIRNPLGVIMTYADFLLDETKDSLSAEHQKFLKIIYSSTEFLLSLIEDLLDITMIESGKLKLNLQHLDLVKLAQKNITLNNSLAAKKNIVIQLECNNSSIFMDIDPQKIEQVFNNLLSNAIKFSYPENSVWVHIFDDVDIVRIEISDKGVGIPNNMISNIFTPFAKISNGGTLGEKNTGLGLSIVKKIVEGHGGTITLSSREGVGTTFYVDLPKKSETTL